MQPNIIEELSYEQLLSELKQDFIARWPDEPSRTDWRHTLALESEPVVKLLELQAYAALALRTRINAAALANLLAFAERRDLDYLVEFYGLTRRPGESDEALRDRTRERIRGSSTAGPAAHYRWHTLSADSRIADAHVDSPRAGLVRISITAKDGPVSADLLARAREHINRKDIRVLTDSVEVRAATAKTVAIRARLTLLPDASQALLEQLPAQIRHLPLGLGRDVSCSQLIALLQVPGVQKVELLAPTTDVVVADDEIAVIDTVELSYGGRNY